MQTTRSGFTRFDFDVITGPDEPRPAPPPPKPAAGPPAEQPPAPGETAAE